MIWLYDTKKDLAMCALLKNGSVSIRNTLRNEPINADIVSVDQVLKAKRRVAWIRNPMQRLISAYSFFKTMNELDQYRGHPNKEETKDWEVFVDYALDSNNPHWQPQIDLLEDSGKFIPNILHKFEDINKLWGNYYKGLLPQLNGCVHENITDYRKSDISKQYEKDFYLWSAL